MGKIWKNDDQPLEEFFFLHFPLPVYSIRLDKPISLGETAPFHATSTWSVMAKNSGFMAVLVAHEFFVCWKPLISSHMASWEATFLCGRIIEPNGIFKPWLADSRKVNSSDPIPSFLIEFPVCLSILKNIVFLNCCATENWNDTVQKNRNTRKKLFHSDWWICPLN